MQGYLLEIEDSPLVRFEGLDAARPRLIMLLVAFDNISVWMLHADSMLRWRMIDSDNFVHPYASYFEPLGQKSKPIRLYICLRPMTLARTCMLLTQS